LKNLAAKKKPGIYIMQNRNMVVAPEIKRLFIERIVIFFPGYNAVAITPYSKTAFSTPETFSDKKKLGIQRYSENGLKKG